MKLQRLRQAQKMSIQEVANAAGVAYTTIANIETGTTRPQRFEVMRRIAAALGVEPQMIDEFQHKFGKPDILTEISEVRS